MLISQNLKIPRKQIIVRVKRENLFHLLEPLLPHVEKPSRYLNHEWGAVEGQTGPFHVCMVYADVYEVGQPNLGLAILYNALNKVPDISCERAYLPWKDMCALLRQHNIPLLSLEGAAPLASFDVVGFTLAHEMIATNILETLDLAGIPLTSELRDEEDPYLFAGGPSVWNSEPISCVFDAILLGDGEEALVEMCECVRVGKLEGISRQEMLLRLSCIQGVYVPSLYDVVYDDSSTRWGYAVPKEGSGAPKVVYKRCLPDLAATDPVAQRIVPYTEIVQDRLSLEIQRGCARGCRFCQAGMTYRPVRERPAQQIVKAGENGLLTSGYDEVSLTSLSTTDHSQCRYILRRMNSVLRKHGVRISIPSQRMDAFGAEMADAVSTSRRGGLTFAPEAGTQRLRDVINKNVSEENLESAARNAFMNGWRRMKLYFMMGLPTETDEDIVAIPSVAKRILDIGREIGGRGVSISASVAVFVPKSYTPFQWVGQISREEAQRRQQLLLSLNHDSGIKIAYHDSGTSLVEGALSKMGRDGFELIYRAWKNGCKFDAWTSEFNFDGWNAAAESLGYSLSDIATETFDIQVKLPWDHTSPGVSKGYLQREYRRAMNEVTTPDCTFTSCTGCAVCQTLKVDNVLMGARS